MIETVFLDWGLAFVAGILFGLAGRRELDRAPRRLRTHAFLWGLAYLHAGILAISLTLYAMNRAWMWMYWVDPRSLPVSVEVLAFALYEMCFVAGFFLASELGRRTTWALAGVTLVALSAAQATARSRLFHFGSLEQFRAGAAPAGLTTSPLHVRPEWWVVSLGGALSIVALAALLRLVWKRAPAA